MKILVTGGSGFIGSHIVKQLLDTGHEVVVYDVKLFIVHRSSFMEKNIQGQIGDKRITNNEERITGIEGDVRDSKLLLESLRGVDAVIHMASFIAVEESVKNPLKYMENNVLGTASLLTAMREAGVKKLVFSSSATVYGEPKSLPILEDFPLSAANPYAASKIAMEVLCQSFSKTDNFDVTILRYFNPYGPGEKHDPETHAIPNFIMAGLEKRPVTLYWKGEQVRDFIYVEDLAAAHIAVLGDMGDQGDMDDRGGFRVFNVGSEAGTKVIDVVNALSDIFGYKMEIKDLGERKGDVMKNYASSEKLKSATGWEAKVKLEEGLRKTVQWFKNS